MLIFRVYNMDLTRFSLIALLFNTIYCWYDPNTKTISTTRFAPQSLSHITSLIKILRLRPDNINGEIVEHNLIETMDINKDGKTVVLFNGHPSDDSPAPFKDLSAALFMHGIENIIFIFIDYTEHHITFMDGLILVDSFGGYIAPMLHKLRIPHDNYHFIGHCLGAEVAASTLRELQKLEPQKINRFTAFDPYYSNSSKILNLDNVVKFTDAYHAGIYDPIFPPFGNVDFYPNGGIFQPSCKKLKVVNERMKCDHKSSIYYYINSMDIKVNAIETKFDEDKKYLIVMDYPKFVTFGHSVDQSESGSFYLPTSEEDPFLLTYF